MTNVALQVVQRQLVTQHLTRPCNCKNNLMNGTNKLVVFVVVVIVVYWTTTNLCFEWQQLAIIGRG